MRGDKASGLTGVPSDLLKTAGKVGVNELTIIKNKRLDGERTPEDWKSSTTIPI